jgi:HEAT repeat protein
MQEEAKHIESLSPEVQDVMRNLVSAIRAVKLYPPNNPVYSQSVKKSYEALDHFLETTPEYHVGVQKTYFSYLHTPVGKDTQLNRAIAQDLFAKGIREIVFSDGVTEDELLEFYRALALSLEEMAMKSGIASILWEKSASHIRVTEAGLDEIITAKAAGGRQDKPLAKTPSGAPVPSTAKKDMQLSRRTLILGDLMADPAAFGAGMIERAMQTRAENESVEDRLFALYQDAGRKIQEEHPDQSDTLFEGLAKSVISLEPPYRDGLVAGKLYGGLDSETVREQKDELEKQVPNEIHEILAGRFSNAWNVKQVAALLKKSSAKKTASPPPPPTAPADLEVIPISQDIIEIARDMADYTSEELEAIKIMGQVGMEPDIIEAAVRTLIFLLSLVKNPRRSAPEEKELNFFSGVVRQLEDMLSYILVKKDYDLATLIIRAFHMPVDPAFKPRMTEALKRNSTKPIIAATISEMRSHSKGSPEYQSAYAYLSNLEREATETLLELLAEENDRTARIFLLDLVKDLGKNQLTLLAEHLSDGRWYVVRNIVSILGESHADQALGYLFKVMNHKDVRIRQEVIKGLITIGGKKSASLLTKFLKDRDIDTQMMAVRGFAELKGIDAEEAKPLVEYLQERSLNKRDQALTLEAINTLGMIGGPEAAGFLKGYTRIRWWRSRKLQKELRTAALGSMEKIERRQDDGGSGTR